MDGRFGTRTGIQMKSNEWLKMNMQQGLAVAWEITGWASALQDVD